MTLVEMAPSPDTLVDKLTSTDFRDIFKKRKWNTSLLDQLKVKLLALNAVLSDAEMKQITNPAVKDWLDKLKDAVLDAEDLFDLINTHSLRSKLNIRESQNVTNQVRNFFSSPFKKLCGEINSRMEDLSSRLDLFVHQKNIVGLQGVSGVITHRRPTSSFVNESFMVGREDDKDKLKTVLLSNGDANNDDIGVLTILGMGGVGKTTLAQLLYNDKEVQQHFELKAWACVSEDFDVTRIIKTLLVSINSKSYYSNNLHYFRVELKRILLDKKFLFVLDDLWNEKYINWHDLQTYFSGGKSGSKVIITTHQQGVTNIAYAFPIHNLGPLSEEDCWALLARHAFGKENSSRSPDLEEISKRIAKKCHGLPIAARTLGGLLRSNVDLREWIKILNNNIWDIPSDDVLPALLISYDYLPAHLKRCFGYCSIFPKDYPLNRKQLVLLWMAEGFIQQSDGDRELEEVGDDYFVELLSRSLIQQSEGDEDQEVFVMHDLINDLARIVAGKSCFRLGFDEMPQNVRHFSYNMEAYDSSKKFENFHEPKRLRSFLQLTLKIWINSHLTGKVLDDLLPTFSSLRVLSMSGDGIITLLPDSISSLVQLRYLNLSGTGIKTLPNVTCMLCNLQTLNLSRCYSLIELPTHIGKLVSLRHLDISGTSLKELPKQILRLKNLRTLTVFVVGKQRGGLRVRELKKFPHLRGRLEILNLQNVTDPMDASEANIKGKVNIEELLLEWRRNGKQDSGVEKDVIEELQPSTNVRELTIKCYGGTCFPSWLGDSSFSNLLSLRISECRYCLALPPLGQLPSLKKLSVYGMEILEIVGPGFYGEVGGSSYPFQPFPSLEHLEFTNMSSWEKWLPPLESGGGKFPFPCLKSLWLHNCPNLASIGQGGLPPNLTSLEILRCGRQWVEGITDWGLQRLTSLRHLSIENDDIVKRLWEDRMLPPSLTILKLSNVSDMKLFDGNGLQILTSLEELWIKDSERLECLAEDGLQHLPSLRSLYIWNCGKLESLPKHTLPPSLSLLTVRNCPLLEERYRSERGEHRSEIAHILFIDINGQVITSD